MTSIDMRVFNQKSDLPHNAVLARQMFAPAIGQTYQIKKGPSRSKTVQRLADDVEPELAKVLRMVKSGFHALNKEFAHRFPAVFTIEREENEINEIVAVYVESVDTDPDKSVYPEYFFRSRYSREGYREVMLIRGWYVAIPRSWEETDAKLLDMEPKRCVLAYFPGSSDKGRFAEVEEGTAIPETQVIKDFRVLSQIVNAYFRKGFVECLFPSGGTCWGRIEGMSGGHEDWVTISALKKFSDAWQFCPDSREPYLIFLKGSTTYEGSYQKELIGDTVLCSDGTILHSYRFSRTEEVKVNRKGGVPEDWKDGYYFTRFYPPGSTLVPAEVIDSFNRDMPEWFRQKLLEKTAV